MTLYRGGGKVFGIALVATAFAIGGCGGGGGGSSTGPSACDPCVTNFQITPLTPEKANTQVRYRMTANVNDPDGDLLGGKVEVSDAAKTLTTPIDASSLQGNTIAVVLVTNPVPPGSYSGTFDVIDAAGHRSNVIPFTLNITAQGRAEVPAGHPMKSSFAGAVVGSRSN
jgi:hypothetical protein